MSHVGVHRRKRPVYAVHTLTAEVPEEGELLPRGRVQESEPGQIYGIDRLLGDDQYVFLSVEDVYAVGGTSGDAYVYDAEELVRRGARWRDVDILSTKEAWEFGKELIRWLKGLSDGEWSDWILTGEYAGDEEDEEILDIEEWFKWGKANAAQLRMAIGRDDGVAIAWDALLKRRDSVTLSGEAAIVGMRGCLCGELLVPGGLSLGEAVGTVVRGRYSKEDVDELG